MRADNGLAFMLQYENIAWFEDGAVKILDRRVYPAEIRFVVCRRFEEVAQAITDMVTQSAGPYTAAPMGMALAAWQCREQREEEQLAYLQRAADIIAHARPTTAKRMEILCRQSLNAAKAALEQGKNPVEAIIAYTLEANDARYRKIEKIAGYLAEKIPAHGAVMTHCFGETIVGMMLKKCREQNKSIRLFCPETRPYFQGARLTATVCRDMGFDTTVITDSMSAFVMDREKVDVFTTAADAICCDGHVVNKVGTLAHAISARYFGVPYYVTGAPDAGHPTADTIHLEFRDPEFTLQAMGVRTAAEGVKGYYPAFDITPPELVRGVVTDLGIYAPEDVHRYFSDGNISADSFAV